MSFVEQITRNDIFTNMINGNSYNTILKDNKKIVSKSIQGFFFESICEILIVCRLLPINFIYKLVEGSLHSYKNLSHASYELQNLRVVLEKNIHQGDNPADIIIKDTDGNIIPFSIKYMKKLTPSNTDVEKLYGILQSNGVNNDDIKVGLIVKDKNILLNHTYHHQANVQRIQLKTIHSLGLLLDEKDIIISFKKFQNRFQNQSVESVIDTINREFLNTSRHNLILKLHQKMFQLRVLRNIEKGDKKHLLQNKPRSGKSILILSILKELLRTKKRALVMTSVPATIDNFIEDLNKYQEFRNIKYIRQDEFKNIDTSFEGIIFSSVQYLKNGENKKEILSRLKLDVCVFDESHLGSSTWKTQDDILGSIDENIINIFASGTGDKTRKFYHIKKENVYEWDIQDEAYMKKIEVPDCFEMMKARHGTTFEECMIDETLNKNYGGCPIPILMQPLIMQKCIERIKEYNLQNDRDTGYSISSVLALQQKGKNKKVEYLEKFQLEKDEFGINFLKEILNTIVSSNAMQKTVMTHIENAQNHYNSRKSTVNNPKLFILYLPTNNGKGTINKLQKTLKRFCEKHHIWDDYYISYSNSLDDSADSSNSYNDFIKKEMVKTKNYNKKGCFLLLGRKGGVGITYPDCDVTISLDEGHNLDEQKQRNYRALTEADEKTIGISVDLNVQRTYYLLNDIIIKFQRSFSKRKTFTEVLHFFREYDIFIFNPQEFKMGKIDVTEITKYFDEISQRIREDIEEDTILENLVCEDLLEEKLRLRDYNQKGKVGKKINAALEGQQQDCPQPAVLLTSSGLVSSNGINSDGTEADDSEGAQVGNVEEEIIKINKTKELCKRIIPILCLLSRTGGERDLENILRNEKYHELFNSIIKRKFS